MILFFDEGNQIRVAEDFYHHDLLARVLFGLWMRDDIKQRPGFYSDGDLFEGDSALSLLDGCARDLAQRAAQGRIVSGHGDLRPEHVHLPPAPGRPLVIDRLEFNEALRQVDPFEELSYLAVECRRLGAPWVGRRLFAQCGRLLDDRPPHRLLRLYGAQRALLRARLCLAHLQEASVQDSPRWRDRAAWYVACASLATGLTSAAGGAGAPDQP